METPDTLPETPKPARKKPGPPPDPNKKKTYQVLMSPVDYSYFKLFEREDEPGNDSRTMGDLLECARRVMPSGPMFGDKARNERGQYLPASGKAKTPRPSRPQLEKKIKELEKEIERLKNPKRSPQPKNFA